MTEALNQFGKLMEKNYDFPRTKIINGFGDVQCDKCGGLSISVSVNPYYKEFAFDKNPMPKTFYGYPVIVEYSEPYIAL